MKIIKVYSKGIFSNRKKVEAKLFKEGGLN
jgi:hypothetical protein